MVNSKHRPITTTSSAVLTTTTTTNTMIIMTMIIVAIPTSHTQTTAAGYRLDMVIVYMYGIHRENIVFRTINWPCIVTLRDNHSHVRIATRIITSL